MARPLKSVGGRPSARMVDSWRGQAPQNPRSGSNAMFEALRARHQGGSYGSWGSGPPSFPRPTPAPSPAPSPGGASRPPMFDRDRWRSDINYRRQVTQRFISRIRELRTRGNTIRPLPWE